MCCNVQNSCFGTLSVKNWYRSSLVTLKLGRVFIQKKKKFSSIFLLLFIERKFSKRKIINNELNKRLDWFFSDGAKIFWMFFMFFWKVHVCLDFFSFGRCCCRCCCCCCCCIDIQSANNFGQFSLTSSPPPPYTPLNPTERQSFKFSTVQLEPKEWVVQLDNY